ncbi:nuclear transport factor 2 family protein [Streptomyces sp. AN091965]|uniref:nuclear transport factor 2 family protein n=1 Tax=Streptomyces sp. AN091965 TaxID=2927803 RepID=UPI001F60F8EE|nr:nuclear transport factor 2 family protein [Streptomyces sp. AN091965]MCI3931929.1 nuclear transport factor 2 family protein [Streptomyces sp. AN091965]
MEPHEETDAEADAETGAETGAESPTDIAVRYHRAVGAGVTGDELAAFFTADVVHHELPNLLFPKGVVRDLPGILEAAEAGRGTLRRQTYDIRNAVACGDKVALEVEWTGELAVPLGTLPAGHVLRARIAAFLDFRDGRISAQRNYDCYEPPA